MMDSRHHSPLSLLKEGNNKLLDAMDDSDEEEEITESPECSPRVNVTDSEEVNAAEQADESRDSKAGTPTNISTLDLWTSMGAFSDPAGAPIDLTDLKQLENDKKAVYSHPLFPLLALLFEKCEIATRSINSFDTDPSLSAFNNEIAEFIEHQQKLEKPFFTDNPEVDSLMIRSIQVFRIHLLELEKVSELCKDFCHRYISCLRSKMRSDVLLRGTADGSSESKVASGHAGASESGIRLLDLSNAFLSSSVSSMSSAASPSTSSGSCTSPLSANCSPPSSPSLSTSSVRSSRHTSNQTPDLPIMRQTKSPSPLPFVGINFEQVIKPFLRLPPSKFNLFNGALVECDSNLSQSLDDTDMVAHDLSLKKENKSKITPDPKHRAKNANEDEDEDASSDKELIEDPNENVRKVPFKSKKQNGEKSSGGHSKRGVLPKQATSIMRSWLFQHIVHPYPTEDEKRAIASQTNLTLLQVNNWFINARRRILQPMLDSANTIHHELVSTGTVQELDLSTSKSKANLSSKKLKTNPQSLNRFWPQSLANIIQAGDLNSKS